MHCIHLNWSFLAYFRANLSVCFINVGRISFLVTVTIATDFYMDPSGIFDNIQPPPAKPSLALKATSVTGNSSTILPFHIINFDALNFKYTLMADNYEVSPISFCHMVFNRDIINVLHFFLDFNTLIPYIGVGYICDRT